MGGELEGGWRELLRGENAARSAVVGGGMVLHAINVFIVATILPSVVADIGGLPLFAWSTTLYVVASLLGGVGCARLMHRFGTRWAYRLALAVFALGCAACAAAPSMPVLLAGRLIQGLGAGTLSALSFTQIRLLFPERLWARAMALVSGVWGIATLLGPAVGGVFAQYGAWRMAFWSLLAATPCLWLLVEAVLPRRSLRPPGPSVAISWVNLGLLLAGVASVSAGGTASTGAWALAGVALGAVLAGAFAWRERTGRLRVLPRHACDPSRPIGASYAAMVLLLLAITTEIFVPYFMQTLHLMTPAAAGYMTAILSGFWTVGSLTASGFAPSRVPAALVAGPLLVASGVVGLAILMPGGSAQIWIRFGVAGCLACMGLGIGVCWPHLAARVFAASAEGEQALAAASITTVTMLGNAYGSAIGGAVANQAGLALPGGVAGGRRRWRCSCGRRCRRSWRYGWPGACVWLRGPPRLRKRPGTVQGIAMIQVYGLAMSGNCWKAATILRLTGRAFEWVETDSNAGATRTPEFLALNPNGKVPVVVLDDGTVLTESNAILLHFAEGTPYLPTPGLTRTQVYQWLFFEQYSHEPYVAVARNLLTYRKEAELYPERMRDCRVRGDAALAIMERRLADSDWLAGEGPSVADLALFAYTHVAHEGGFDLSATPSVAAWVARVRALPGLVPLD